MKSFLVIGASSGIGKSVASRLTELGHKVIGTYNKNEISNVNVSSHPLDIRTDFDLDFIPESIDGVVYCPGSINLKPFSRINPQDFKNDFDLQVVGAIKVIQKALKSLKKSGNASIVLFSTVAVQSGFNFHSQVSTSKGAIEGLAKALAAELAPTIRVNVVAPSLTDTPLAAQFLNTDQKKAGNAQRHPLKRIGSPDDIAHAVEFLLSERSSWMTGQVLHIDGGISTLKV